MDYNDDRTPEQRATHYALVVGTDSFLSVWGKAQGGTSYAAWACPPEWARHVRDRIEGRGDMKRVRTVYGAWRPRGRGHAHVYVVTETHPYAPHWVRSTEPAKV